MGYPDQVGAGQVLKQQIKVSHLRSSFDNLHMAEGGEDPKKDTKSRNAGAQYEGFTGAGNFPKVLPAALSQASMLRTPLTDRGG
jgi:hypothetical protein